MANAVAGFGADRGSGQGLALEREMNTEQLNEIIKQASARGARLSAIELEPVIGDAIARATGLKEEPGAEFNVRLSDHLATETKLKEQDAEIAALREKIKKLETPSPAIEAKPPVPKVLPSPVSKPKPKAHHKR